MIAPLLSSWIEQSDNAARFWISRGQIRTLEFVTAIAREREVAHVIAATVLPRYNVLDLVHQKRCVNLSTRNDDSRGPVRSGARLVSHGAPQTLQCPTCLRLKNGDHVKRFHEGVILGFFA